MKKIVLFTSLFSLMVACKSLPENKQNSSQNTAINQLLNQWHKDVAEFKYEAYFNKMASNAVFVGTDASEVWSKQEFMNFSKPFFDKKSTWNFKPLQRNIYIDTDNNIAWFDEILDTWMGICRGSGVVVSQNNQWKIQHYVLSVTIPNDVMQQVIQTKKKQDSILIRSFNK
jgi:hypothetical protein